MDYNQGGCPTTASPIHGCDNNMAASRNDTKDVAAYPQMAAAQDTAGTEVKSEDQPDEEISALYTSPDLPLQDPVPHCDSPLHYLTALRTLTEAESVGTLKKAVDASRPLLRQISRALQPTGESSYVAQKLETINALLQAEEVSEYILGVVGGTGNGKSSLINSLLCESKLIPTNCARACTAVVTEIAWNDSDLQTERYQAKVEYISVKEWRAELELLRDNLCSVDDYGQEVTVISSAEANIAWAKIREVYPNLTKDMFINSTTDALMADPDVAELLGTTKCVSASNVDAFCKDINCYINSRDESQDTADATVEKNSFTVEKMVGALAADGNNACSSHSDVDSDDTADNDDDDESCDSDDSFQPKKTAIRAPRQDQSRKKKKKKLKKMALWPLINVVRIRTKAPILSTGLILVDLISAVQPSITRGCANNSIATGSCGFARHQRRCCNPVPQEMRCHLGGG